MISRSKGNSQIEVVGNYVGAYLAKEMHSNCIESPKETLYFEFFSDARFCTGQIKVQLHLHLE